MGMIQNELEWIRGYRGMNCLIPQLQRLHPNLNFCSTAEK